MSKLIEVPRSPEAERSVLGAVLVDNARLADVSAVLHAGDFHDRAHQAVFAAMQALSGSGRPVDLLTLSEAMGDSLESAGGIPFLSKLMDGIPKLVNAKHYADIVKDKSRRRALIQAAKELMESAPDLEEGELASSLDAAVSRLLAWRRREEPKGVASIADLAKGYVLDMADRMDGNASAKFVHMGLASLDKKTAGMRPGSLVVVAGDTSQGKTSFALNVAMHVSATTGVLVVTLEMTAHQLAERMLSTESRVDSLALATAGKGRELSEHQFLKVGKALERIKGMDISVVEPTGMTADINWLRSTIQREMAVRAKDGRPTLGLIVVDYLQLMSGPEPRPMDRLNAITREMKLIALETGGIVMVLSQLSRQEKQNYKGGVRQAPDIHELKGSGNIENDADLILLVHRPEHYLAKAGKPAGDMAKKAQIIIGKNRGGPVGLVTLGFKNDCCLFYDDVDSSSGGWPRPEEAARKLMAPPTRPTEPVAPVRVPAILQGVLSQQEDDEAMW